MSRNYALRPDVPVDPPDLSAHCNDCRSGGQLYKLYCGSCHNARPLGERPFANYEVAVAHMRDQAYLTGKEYRQIIHFMRRWHDLGPPTRPNEPSPKRLIFGQPIPELREDNTSDENGPDDSGPPAAAVPNARAVPGTQPPRSGPPAPIP